MVCISVFAFSKCHDSGALQFLKKIVPFFYIIRLLPFVQALKNLRLKNGRAFCRLGDLAKNVGWRHNDLIKRLEDKRKVCVFIQQQAPVVYNMSLRF